MKIYKHQNNTGGFYLVGMDSYRPNEIPNCDETKFISVYAKNHALQGEDE